MAYLTCWHMTELPTEIVEIIERDVQKYDEYTKDSEVRGEQVDKVIRNSKNSWIPSSNWIGGWLWYYIDRINRENFCYDLTDIDGCSIQYTQYGPGQFYNWHQDDGLGALDKEKCRKLSVVLQLSSPEEYTGGEFQLLNEGNHLYMAPKKRGTLIIFDSRARHRVRPVHSGIRKSLVGWIVGPRWR